MLQNGRVTAFAVSEFTQQGNGAGGGGCKIIPSPATSGRYVFTKHTAGNNRRSVRSGRTWYTASCTEPEHSTANIYFNNWLHCFKLFKVLFKCLFCSFHRWTLVLSLREVRADKNRSFALIKYRLDINIVLPGFKTLFKSIIHEARNWWSYWTKFKIIVFS